jgi:hypothetical protein
MIKQYVLVCWDNYYPDVNNCRGTFDSIEEAKEHYMTEGYEFDRHEVVPTESFLKGNW